MLKFRFVPVSLKEQYLVDNFHCQKIELSPQLLLLHLKELLDQGNLLPHHFLLRLETPLGQALGEAHWALGAPPGALPLNPLLNTFPAEAVLALGRDRVDPELKADGAGEGFLEVDMPPGSFLHHFIFWFFLGHIVALQFIRDITSVPPKMDSGRVGNWRYSEICAVAALPDFP